VNEINYPIKRIRAARAGALAVPITRSRHAAGGANAASSGYPGTPSFSVSNCRNSRRVLGP
jgi:hypothetical protein